MPAVDALDRARTLIVVTVSPLEEHGPHLPLGVDAFTARHFAQAIAERVVGGRPGWSVAPLHRTRMLRAPSESAGSIVGGEDCGAAP